MWYYKKDGNIAWHNNGFHPRIAEEECKKLGNLWRFVGKDKS